MGRYSKFAIAAMMALAMAGCSSEGGEQASNPSATPTPTSSPASTPVASNPSTPTTPTQVFNNPVVPGKSGTTGVIPVANPNLIQSTNALSRVPVVVKGRNDPFAQIVPPPPQAPVAGVGEVPRRPVPSVPSLPVRNPRIATVAVAPLRPRSGVISGRVSVGGRTAFNKPSRVAIAKSPKPGRGFTPVLPRVFPQVVPNPSLVSVLPPTPQPELARAVAVTGVVMVGRQPQAIIKVPTEPTSRYVQAGDRLSNGLLVKRIEMNEGSDPIVIFEQFGIEVARMVGEGAAAPATTASADAVPPPPSNVPTGAS